MPDNTLSTIVHEINNGSVSLKTGSGQIINWPKSRLHDVNVGDTVYLAATGNISTSPDHHSDARTMLNQLLGGTS